MSVFQKLKGTFQNAQQDLVDGLRALATLDSQPRIDQLRWARARDINLDTGADLLYNYQKIWKLIQTDTKESAIKASEVSKMLAPMFKRWSRQADGVQQLAGEVKAIPDLLSTLTHMHTLLDGLRQDFAAAERGLDMLENMCEEQEHKKRMAEEERKLALYALQRENEFQRLKVDLAQRHAKKMAQVETNKIAQLQERAEAFTSAFKEDLEFYRTHGRPDRLPTEFPKVTSLSEIEIDQDKQALDSFLGPSTDTSQAQAVPSSEDTYFEDDYIADFSVKEDLEYVPEVDYLTVPVKIDSLSVESLEDSDEEQQQGDAAATHSEAQPMAQGKADTTAEPDSEIKEGADCSSQPEVKDAPGARDGEGAGQGPTEEKERNMEESTKTEESCNDSEINTSSAKESEPADS